MMLALQIPYNLSFLSWGLEFEVTDNLVYSVLWRCGYKTSIPIKQTWKELAKFSWECMKNTLKKLASLEKESMGKVSWGINRYFYANIKDLK